MAHLARTFAHILAAAAIMLLLGFGTATHGILGFALSAIVAGGLTTFVISLALNYARQILGLATAGMLVQFALFVLTATFSLKALAWLFPAVLTVTSGFAAALTMLGAFFLVASVTGYIQIYRGRSWLPKKFPTQKSSH